MDGIYKTSNPTILVIFGATGDLSKRKLLPALFNLYQKKMFPPLFQVVGFSRQDLEDEVFRGRIKEWLRGKGKEEELEAFSKLFIYKQGFFDKKSGYDSLKESLGFKDNEWQVCSNKLFYLAVPPDYYKTIFNFLAESGLTEPCSPEEGWTRVIVEKPFGKDLRTAEELDALLGKLFKEEQIYRIDHYLGKETVQNILAFRFTNSFLEPSWNKNWIESVHIRIFETDGVEDRGAFYDSVGALRDVGQNHLLQMLALLTMDVPLGFDAESIRKRRVEILQTLKRVVSTKVNNLALRGQYERYKDIQDVSPKSMTETYFKITAFLDNSRWAGVPMYLEGGKKLKEAKAEAVITFKHKTPCLCPPESGKHYKNILRYRIQPQEGISISFWVKRPGSELVLEEKDFAFDYQSAYSKELFVDAYEKLLLDAFAGNQTLFVSTDEIKASWKFIDTILNSWKKNKTPLILYTPNVFPEDN